MGKNKKLLSLRRGNYSLRIREAILSLNSVGHWVKDLFVHRRDFIRMAIICIQYDVRIGTSIPEAVHGRPRKAIRRPVLKLRSNLLNVSDRIFACANRLVPLCVALGASIPCSLFRN